MEITTYLSFGVPISLFFVWYYRKDGHTRQPNELYWATLAPFLWPLLIAKFLLDRVVERVHLSYEREFHEWLSLHLTSLNLDYDKYYAHALGSDRPPLSFLDWARGTYSAFRRDIAGSLKSC